MLEKNTAPGTEALESDSRTGLMMAATKQAVMDSTRDEADSSLLFLQLGRLPKSQSSLLI